MLTLGLVGVGRMGGAMARTLARAGFDLTLWNRDPAKAETVAAAVGARVAPTAAEVARKVDVVITSLADDAAAHRVYLDRDGVVEGMGPGKVAIDTSTIDPSTVLTIGEAVDATGGDFADCPVSGSVSTVEAGTLTIMAGGDPEVIARVRPVLEPLSSRVVETGPRGSGAITKLAVNGLVHGLNVALAEALVLAEKAGVDREIAYEVFAGGAAGAPFVQYKREAYLHPDDAPVAFSLDLVAKDLALITGFAGRVGASMRQADVSRAIVDAAIASGLGDGDMSAVATYLRAGSA